MISNILLFNFGGSEMILVIVVVLLFFGGKKIPELMRGVGNGIREFKDASKGEDNRTVDKVDKKD